MGQGVTMLILAPGLAPKKAKDKRAYTSILYGNGPGYSIRDGARPAASLPAAGRSLLGVGWGHRVAGDSIPWAWPLGLHRVPVPPRSSGVTWAGDTPTSG